MPTPHQIKLIHVAAKQANLSDEQYRTILRSTGGVESSKLLDQAGFEDVMALIEDCGYRDPDKGGDYWRGKVREREGSAGGRMVWKIHKLAEGGRYQLQGLCERFSAGRASRPEDLKPREAWKLIEMLKASSAREANRTSSRGGAEGNPEGELFPSSPSELCASAPLRSIGPQEQEDVPF